MLAFQVAEERFSHSVIPAIATTTHARTELVVSAPTIELVAAKLTALIRMDDHRRLGAPAPYGHHQRIHYKARLYTRPHAPAHQLTRMQVQHYS